MDIPREYFKDTLSILRTLTIVDSRFFSPTAKDALNDIKIVEKNLENLLAQQDEFFSVNKLSQVINSLQSIFECRKESTGIFGWGEKKSPHFCDIYLKSAIQDIQTYKQQAMSEMSNQTTTGIEELAKQIRELQNQQKEQQEKQHEQEEKIEAINFLLPMFRRLDFGNISREEKKKLELLCGGEMPKHQLAIEAPLPSSKNENIFFTTTQSKIKPLDPKYTKGLDQIPKDTKDLEVWRKDPANAKVYDMRKVKSSVSDCVYALIFELTALQIPEKELVSKMVFWLLDTSLVEADVYKQCAWTNRMELLQQHFQVDPQSQIGALLNQSMQFQYSDDLPNMLLSKRFESLSKPTSQKASGGFLPANEDASKRYVKNQVGFVLQKEQKPANTK